MQEYFDFTRFVTDFTNYKIIINKNFNNFIGKFYLHRKAR